MSDVAIKCDGLSKQYRIGEQERYKALRDVITDVASAPFRHVRSAFTRNGKNGSTRSSELETRNSDRFWALQDVSFEVNRGEVIGIIGRNGAGKSTLLKILSRITKPTKGHAKIHGRVGSLLEVGTGFHPELTGRENIYLNAAILGMRKAEVERKFDEIVSFAEVEKFIDTPVKRYSSGMYTRLAFAVAAHMDTDILVVDEVLAVGDGQFQKKCLGKMGEVAQTGRTVLFVSHNMVAVRTLCTRVILLNAGKIEGNGPPAAIVSSYLDSGRNNLAETSWTDESLAPGNELYRLRGVRVRRDDGEVTSTINRQQSFQVEIDYVSLVAGSRLGTTVVVYNDDGICIFSSISNREPKWHGISRPRGLFRSICRIPSNLLVEGKYFISTLVWGDNYNFASRQDSVVQFEIHEDGESRGDYFGGWSGVIHPALEWSADLIEEQETEVSR